MGGRFFASKDSLNLAPLPEHDASLSGDTLGLVSINAEWRKIIAPAIEAYYRIDLNSETSLDNYELLLALFEDFYDE